MKKYLLLVVFILVYLIPVSTFAQLRLHSLFTDHMVLQQRSEVPIWGWATAGDKITIKTSWDNKKYSINANEIGKWLIKVATPIAGGPYEITVSDGTPFTFKDVMIGEVWFCGGQSNMEMPMKGFKSQPIIGSNEAILKSTNPNIRLYIVPRSSVPEKQANSKPSSWRQAAPESVANFSATAYYFGQLLNEMLHVPIGLINDSYGGSSIEAWMSPESLQNYPDVKVPSKTDSIKEISRTPTTLYNGMLAPVIGYGIKGALWYQGESNVDRTLTYQSLFTTMVKEWREKWGVGEFPFYYMQIAPFQYKDLTPNSKAPDNQSAYLREAQRSALKTIPNSGMAVLMDLGEERSIHPANKKQGGQRLAYLALAQTYGLKGFGYASPNYDSFTVEDGTATVKFVNTPNGLTSFGKELAEFEIAGADHKFYPASAKIAGSSVKVSSVKVKTPMAVRYAFKDFVVGDLFSNEGLPVSSFKTDDWAPEKSTASIK